MRKLLSVILVGVALLGSHAQAATSFTQNVCAPQPSPGDVASQSAWGGLLNAGSSIFDGITSAVASVNVAGSANVILTFTCGSLDQTDAAHFNLSGALTGNITVFWPNARGRMFSVTNSTTGSFTLTLAVNNGSGVAAGTTQIIGQGTTQLYIDDGTNILPRGGLNLVSVQSFSASGTYTPTAGTKFAVVQMVGGGGGGGVPASDFATGGGGSGETALGVFTASQIGASKAVTIGAGGTAGNPGATTSLGSLLTAAGGPAGSANTPGSGATGGTGTGLHTKGGSGGIPINGTFESTASSICFGGQGAASLFGAGGYGGYGTSFNGQTGQAPGSGGGGAGAFSGVAGAAGSGAAGLMIITEYQ